MKRKKKKSKMYSPSHVVGDASMSLGDVLDRYSPAEQYMTATIRVAKGFNNQTLLEKDAEQIIENITFVWCDGAESKKWVNRKVPYLGIRISPNFILHESIARGNCWWGNYVDRFAKKCSSRLLTHTEFLLLRKVWNKVSEMRVQANDCKLPNEGVFCIADEEYRKYMRKRYLLCNIDGVIQNHLDDDEGGNILLNYCK